MQITSKIQSNQQPNHINPQQNTSTKQPNIIIAHKILNPNQKSKIKSNTKQHNLEHQTIPKQNHKLTVPQSPNLVRTTNTPNTRYKLKQTTTNKQIKQTKQIHHKNDNQKPKTNSKHPSKTNQTQTIQAQTVSKQTESINISQTKQNKQTTNSKPQTTI